MAELNQLNVSLLGDALETECKRYALMEAGIKAVFKEVEQACNSVDED